MCGSSRVKGDLQVQSQRRTIPVRFNFNVEESLAEQLNELPSGYMFSEMWGTV